MKYFCSQHERALSAARSGQWPDACDSDLRTHIADCPTCREIVTVAQALRQSRKETLDRIPDLPAPGLLWWRAQIRRRNAAIERMAQPIAIAETAALCLVLIAAGAFVVWQRQDLTTWFFGALQAPFFLLLGAVSFAVFGGFAVYLMRTKE